MLGWEIGAKASPGESRVTERGGALVTSVRSGG